MKQNCLSRFMCLIMAFCAISATMEATEIEASLRPVSTSPSAEYPFTSPLEEVGFVFDRCIKLFDGASVFIKCDGEVFANAVGLDIENYVGENSKQGTLIAKFDKQNLPKGKTYTVCLPKGSVGWVECYNDIQIVNRDFTFEVEVPGNLGAARSELKDDSPVVDSSSFALCFYYGYEIAPVGSPEFMFYKNGEFVGKIPAHVSWDWNLGQVRPEFPEKTNFDFGVKYSLVLPAGSVSALHRDDIVNEEYSLNFTGYYIEPDAPFSYSWCSLFTDHSDVLNEVSFTYRSPVGITDDAVIELYEGDCETLVKSAPAYQRTDVNCWLVCCDFGGFHMSSEKGYTIVVPEGAVYLLEFPDIKGAGGKVNVSGLAAVSDIAIKQKANAPVYDLMGREVKNPMPGRIYIRNGAKIVFQQR